jgi:hypothetical protein
MADVLSGGMLDAHLEGDLLGIFAFYEHAYRPCF